MVYLYLSWGSGGSPPAYGLLKVDEPMLIFPEIARTITEDNEVTTVHMYMIVLALMQSGFCTLYFNRVLRGQAKLRIVVLPRTQRGFYKLYFDGVKRGQVKSGLPRTPFRSARR